MSDRLFVGLSGLATDIQTLEQLLRFRLNMYKLREERDIKPETFSALVSHILYEKRCAGWLAGLFGLLVWFACLFGLVVALLLNRPNPRTTPTPKTHSFGPYFVEPLVAGLKEDNTPFISGMDLIGAPVFAKVVRPSFGLGGERLLAYG